VGLPWKESHSAIPHHFTVCLNHLGLHLLKNPELLCEYSSILQEQLLQRVIESVPESTTIVPQLNNTHKINKLQSCELFMMARNNTTSLNDCLR